MREFVEKYGYNVHSQNGEDGLVAEAFLRIDKEKSLPTVAVEFGGADGYYCSNTARLRDHGWSVLMYDLEERPPHVFKKEITPDNVNELPDCSVLSIDIDGNDYYVWQAYRGRPDIVIIEINSSLPPMRAHTSMDHGTSYITMLLLGLTKGYFLLAHTGNMVFVLNEYRGLFPEIIGDGLNNYQEYFNTEWL